MSSSFKGSGPIFSLNDCSTGQRWHATFFINFCFTATVAIVKSIPNCSVVMNERKALPPFTVTHIHTQTHTNTEEGSTSESNGHTALRGLRGCLPSPLCWGSQPVRCVCGWVYTYTATPISYQWKVCCSERARLFGVFYAFPTATSTGVSPTYRRFKFHSRQIWTRLGKNNDFTGRVMRRDWNGPAEMLLLVTEGKTKQYACSLLQGGRRRQGEVKER